MEKSRVLIVDDHQLIIDGLKAFVSKDESLEFVGECNNGEDAIRYADILNPDIILMDIEMPRVSGIQASEEIKKTHPEIKVLIISMHQEKGLIKKLLERGVDGYLLKNSSQEEVLSAISVVRSGKKYFSEDITLALLDRNISGVSGYKSSENGFLTELTDREIEILKAIAEGHTNKEIGEELHISHRTVDTHRTNLMKKLEVNNVAGLIRFAFKNGLIS
ncbi:MAG: response regulator transcription factor [Crocinitomicaceae bacterium]|nr:response regulator transcription factor [Crocinitomicaceae bacterium]